MVLTYFVTSLANWIGLRNLLFLARDVKNYVLEFKSFLYLN